MSALFRKLQGLFLSHPPNYSEVTDKIAASGLPSLKKHIDFIKKSGITAIVSLTEKPLDRGLLEGKQLTYVHMPLKNHEPADPSTLLKIVEKIEELLSGGHRILIHCQAGRGRTGMVLTAYFMKKYGLGWAESLEKIRKIRPGSVEKPQERSLQELEKMLKADS